MQKKPKTEQAAWRELYVSCQGRFKHTHFWTKKQKRDECQGMIFLCYPDKSLVIRGEELDTQLWGSKCPGLGCICFGRSWLVSVIFSYDAEVSSLSRCDVTTPPVRVGPFNHIPLLLLVVIEIGLPVQCKPWWQTCWSSVWNEDARLALRHRTRSSGFFSFERCTNRRVVLVVPYCGLPPFSNTILTLVFILLFHSGIT